MRKQRLVGEYDIPVSQMCLCGDSLYIVSSQWSNISQQTVTSYALFDVKEKQLRTDRFITDGTDSKINRPYSVFVNPISKEIFVSDAKNYVSPGTLYCFDQSGKLSWSVRTGDIPAHIVFTGNQSYNK